MKYANHQQIQNWDLLLTSKNTNHWLQSHFWGDFKKDFQWQPIHLYLPSQNLPILALKRYIKPLLSSVIYLPKAPSLNDLTPHELQEIFSFLTKKLAPQHHAFLIEYESETPDNHPKFLEIANQYKFTKALNHPQFKTTLWLKTTTDLSDTMAKFKSKTRYNIRLATKKGVTTKIQYDEKSIYNFYQFYQQTGHNRFSVRTYPYYQKLISDLLKNTKNHLKNPPHTPIDFQTISPPPSKNHPPLGFLLEATYQNQPLSYIFLILFNQRLYYHFGASGPHHQNLMPNYLLQWSAIQLAQRLQATIYDFVGLPENLTSPDTQKHSPQIQKDPFYGVAKFKLGFGGEIKNFAGNYQWYHSPKYQKLWPYFLPWYKRGLKKIYNQLYY